MKNHGVVQHHGRARPRTKSNGVSACAACECALVGSLLSFRVSATPHVHIERKDTTPRTRKFARAMEMPSNHAAQEHGHIRARTLTARPGRKSYHSSPFEDSQSKRQAKSYFKRKAKGSSCRDTRAMQRSCIK